LDYGLRFGDRSMISE